MSKRTIITVLSSLIILSQFVGLPKSILSPVIIVLSLIIIYVARSGVKKKVSIQNQQVVQ